MREPEIATTDERTPVLPRVWIKSTTFSDGTMLHFGEDDIIVLVGPNNAGKSAALRELMAKLRDCNYPGVVTKELSLEAVGSQDDLSAWMQETCQTTGSTPSHTDFHKLGHAVNLQNARHWWQRSSPDNHLVDLAYFFARHLTAEARLSAAKPAPSFRPRIDPRSHPIQHLYASEALENEISAQFRQAFGLDLIVDHVAGTEIPLLVGPRPERDLKAGEDRLSQTYRDKLAKLPALQTQGDGMRSFVGVLLEATIVEYSIILLDEPEAFLHPPQARLLGRMLAQKKPAQRQLIIATHSNDALRGFLDANTSNVRVVRIRRNENVNIISELDNNRIQELWADPLLRQSNVLDGLFYEKVVVCEGDADCRFYAALSDALAEAKQEPSPDIMFTHCGGKERMPMIIQALRAVGVPVVAVADFDLLNNDYPLRSIYGALGGNWGEIEDVWRKVKTTIDQKKPELQAEEVVKEIRGVLDGVREQYLPKDARNKVMSILRRSTPWSVAKEQGKGFVPAGEATRACNEVLRKCRDRGLFIVEIGQLEGFAQSVGGHGPSWVNKVLEEKNFKSDPELEAARKFVSDILLFQ